MAFDAGMMRAVLCEISESCLGARVEKVHQPTKDEVLLLLRGKRLSISFGAVCPRISMTGLVKDNPAVPPMLCMLLRKHLCGALLLSVEQCGFDRVCRLSFSGYDEMGFPTEKHLYAELMGKYSNLILTDGKDKIIAVAKPVDFSDSEIRQLLPGLTYHVPPVPDKRNPMTLTEEEFLSAYASYPAGKAVANMLTDLCGGTAISVAREIVYRAGGRIDLKCDEMAADTLWRAFSAWFTGLREKEFRPSVMRAPDGAPLEYCYAPLSYLAEGRGKTEFPATFAALFDGYFGERERQERIRLRAQDLVRLVTHTKSKLEKKLASQREEYADSAKADLYRREGDLITANLYRLKKGMPSFTATDYMCDPPAETEVTLDTRYTPAQNAQRAYRMYAKAKKAREVLSAQIALTENELSYMESVSVFLSRAETEADLLEIRDELYRAGYASRLKHYTPPKHIKARPLEFTTSGGYRVLCGRNNLQNDLLTFRIAEKGDIWFHVKGEPGSHVILVCGGEEPPEADYTEAAEIAAAHSSAKGDLVAVDYTRVKNVKKPPASKPGYVIYKTNYTAYVRRAEKKGQTQNG